MFGKIALAATAATLAFGLGAPAFAGGTVIVPDAIATFDGNTTHGLDPDLLGVVGFEQRADGKYEADAFFLQLDKGKYTVYVDTIHDPSSPLAGDTAVTPFKVCEFKGKDKNEFDATGNPKPVKPSECHKKKLDLKQRIPVGVRIVRNADGVTYEAPVTSGDPTFGPASQLFVD
jgi:hypothetical protein